LWFERQVQADSYISATELASFYELNAPRFQTPPRVRWERIIVYANRCPSPDAASKIIEFLAERANGIESSPPSDFSPDWIETEVHGWTDVSSERSPGYANLLRQIPVGKTSQVIRENNQLMLFRILERREESRIPLSEAADTIRSEIMQQRREVAELKLLARLWSQSRVWTVFDINERIRPIHPSSIELTQPTRVNPSPTNAPMTSASSLNYNPSTNIQMR
jgi:hypothetical protein